MPKKRTSAESSKDEQTSEGSYVFQEDDDAKRTKLSSSNDTTLQDLPVELLECILLKAVAMEVKALKLAKSVWKEKADLVISRLGNVCSQWNNIVTTDFFTREVHRKLDGTGQETIRLEILHQPSFQLKVYKVTTLRDEMFLLCSPLDRDDVMINVYDRNNMAEVKDVIPLPGISLSSILPVDMAACSVSNCVYILDMDVYCRSIFRIAKDKEHHFKVSPWIVGLRLTVSYWRPMSVSANGNVIILSSQENPGPVYRPLCGPDRHAYTPANVGIYMYNPNASLQHKIMLSPDIYGLRRINGVIQKSNGNLVLLSANDQYKTQLLEIDTNGAIVRQYQSSLDGWRSAMNFADIHGRILINDFRNRIELLDPEFNQLEIAGPRLLENHFYYLPQIHFNSERNEIVRIEKHKYDAVTGLLQATALNIFRFTEE